MARSEGRLKLAELGVTYNNLQLRLHSHYFGSQGEVPRNRNSNRLSSQSSVVVDHDWTGGSTIAC